MLKFIEYLNGGSDGIVALVVFKFYFDVIVYIFSFCMFSCLMFIAFLLNIMMPQNYLLRIILLMKPLFRCFIWNTKVDGTEYMFLYKITYQT